MGVVVEWASSGDELQLLKAEAVARTRHEALFAEALCLLREAGEAELEPRPAPAPAPAPDLHPHLQPPPPLASRTRTLSRRGLASRPYPSRATTVRASACLPSTSATALSSPPPRCLRRPLTAPLSPPLSAPRSKAAAR